jgi:hypothetical protein
MIDTITPPAAPTDTTPTPADTTTAPEGVPAKFWDAEKGAVNVDALLKSYGELEKAQSAPADPTDHSAAQEAVKNAGLDWDTIVGKATVGGLEDSDFTALEQVGIPEGDRRQLPSARSQRKHAADRAGSHARWR